jgi:hypothetical protein
MRMACSARLRDAMHYIAASAVGQDDHWKAMYQRLIRKYGKTGRARVLRQVADRLLAVIVAMLRTGKTYDPSLLRTPPLPE